MNEVDILRRVVEQTQRVQSGAALHASNFRIYDSIHEFTDGDTKPIHLYNSRSEWCGPRDIEESKAYFKRGADEDVMRKARELLAKIDTHIHGVEGKVWVPEIYGAYPIVPDYLSGDPMCMRTRTMRESDMAPIHVVLNTFVSAGVDAAIMEKRATACAAFVMKLSERRPVELWMAGALYNEVVDRDVGFRVKLDMPMNLNQVLAAYDRSVCRVLSACEIESLSSDNSGLPTDFNGYFSLKGYDLERNRSEYMKAFREYMKLGKDDLVIDAGYLSDTPEIDRNPVEWVKNMLIRYGFEAEE